MDNKKKAGSSVWFKKKASLFFLASETDWSMIFFKPAVCVNKTHLSYFECYNILCVAFKCVVSFYRSHKLKKKDSLEDFNPCICCRFSEGGLQNQSRI